MAATRRDLKSAAERSFRDGSGPEKNPFSSVEPPVAANEDVAPPGFSNQRVEDLVVDLGHGNEEAMPYRLYSGSSLIRKGEILAVRFHDRHVLIEGARLQAVRDAISNRRCLVLRKSSRPEILDAQRSLSPIVTAVRVVRPKQGNEEILMLAEGKSVQDLEPTRG